MKAMTKCCEKCFEDLARKSTGAAKIWLNICALCEEAETSFARIRFTDFPELRELEMMGFVTTLEQPPYLLIKINGLNTADSGNYFCIKGKDHE